MTFRTKFLLVCFDLLPQNNPITACDATSFPGYRSFPKWAKLARIVPIPPPNCFLLGLITTPLPVCKACKMSRFCFSVSKCLYTIIWLILFCGIMKPPVWIPCPNILSIPKLPRLVRAPVAKPGNIFETADEAISNIFGKVLAPIAAIVDPSEPPCWMFSRPILTSPPLPRSCSLFNLAKFFLWLR